MADKPREARALVDNAGDPEQVAAGERTLAQRAAAVDRAAGKLMAAPETFPFLVEVLRACNYEGSLYPTIDAPAQAGWYAGQQEAGKHLAKLLRRANPDAFARLMAQYDELTQMTYA